MFLQLAHLRVIQIIFTDPGFKIVIQFLQFLLNGDPIRSSVDL